MIASNFMHLDTSFQSQNVKNVQIQSPNEQKLRHAAAEFESMLLSKWWSAMRESGLGGLDETDPGHDTLDQLGMQALSSAVASAGGIGIGAMLVRDLLSNTPGKTAPDKESQLAVARQGISNISTVPK